MFQFISLVNFEARVSSRWRRQPTCKMLAVDTIVHGWGGCGGGRSISYNTTTRERSNGQTLKCALPNKVDEGKVKVWREEDLSKALAPWLGGAAWEGRLAVAAENGQAAGKHGNTGWTSFNLLFWFHFWSLFYLHFSHYFLYLVSFCLPLFWPIFSKSGLTFLSSFWSLFSETSLIFYKHKICLCLQKN